MAFLNDHYLFLIALIVITVFNQHLIAAQNDRNRQQSADSQFTQQPNPSGRQSPPPDFQSGPPMSSDRFQQGRPQAPSFDSEFQSNFRSGPPSGDFQAGRPPQMPRDDGSASYAGTLEHNAPEFSKDSRSDRFPSSFAPDSQSDRYSSSFPRNFQPGNYPPPPPPPHFARNHFSSMTPPDFQSESRFPQFRSSKSPSSSDFQSGSIRQPSFDFPSDFQRPSFGPPPSSFDMRFGPPPPPRQGGWQNENNEFENNGQGSAFMDNESAGYGDRGMQSQQAQRPPGPKRNGPPPASSYN